MSSGEIIGIALFFVVMSGVVLLTTMMIFSVWRRGARELERRSAEQASELCKANADLMDRYNQLSSAYQQAQTKYYSDWAEREKQHAKFVAEQRRGI